MHLHKLPSTADLGPSTSSQRSSSACSYAFKGRNTQAAKRGGRASRSQKLLLQCQSVVTPEAELRGEPEGSSGLSPRRL